MEEKNQEKGLKRKTADKENVGNKKKRGSRGKGKTANKASFVEAISDIINDDNDKEREVFGNCLGDQNPINISEEIDIKECVGKSGEERAKNKKSGKFRLECKNMFLTYSQIKDISFERILKNCDAFFRKDDQRNWKSILMCKENHNLTLGEHVHILICLTSTMSICSANKLDVLMTCSTMPEGLHGNYSSARNVAKVEKYIMKNGVFRFYSGFATETYNPVTNIVARKDKTNKMVNVVAAQMMKGATVKQISLENPGFMIMNLKKVQEFKKTLDAWNMDDKRAPSEDWKDLAVYSKDPKWKKKLYHWLNEACRAVKDPKVSHKDVKACYLYGEAGVGKTSLFLWLRKMFNLWVGIPEQNGWKENFDPVLHEFIILEEFYGGEQISWLKMVTEGNEYTQFTTRGMAPTFMSKFVPVLIISNKRLKDCYKNYTNSDENLKSFEALTKRIIQIDVPDGDKIGLYIPSEYKRPPKVEEKDGVRPETNQIIYDQLQKKCDNLVIPIEDGEEELCEAFGLSSSEEIGDLIKEVSAEEDDWIQGIINQNPTQEPALVKEFANNLLHISAEDIELDTALMDMQKKDVIDLVGGEEEKESEYDEEEEDEVENEFIPRKKISSPVEDVLSKKKILTCVDVKNKCELVVSEPIYERFKLLTQRATNLDKLEDELENNEKQNEIKSLSLSDRKLFRHYLPAIKILADIERAKRSSRKRIIRQNAFLGEKELFDRSGSKKDK